MTGGATRRAGRRTVLLGLAGAAGAAVLGGCARASDPPTTISTSPSPTPSADNPLGVDRTAGLSVVIADDGLGQAYVTEQVALYNAWAGRPAATSQRTKDVSTDWRRRFAGDHPPDLLDDSGVDPLPMEELVAGSQLADLTPLLDAPSLEDPKVPVRDTLLPEAVQRGEFDGICRALNYVYGVWGLWYSRSLFAEHGWKPARTWDEFLALAAKISSVTSPFTHPGRRPEYLATLLTGLAVKHGGQSVASRIDNLAPDAWTNPSITAAAEAIVELVDRGYIPSAAANQDAEAAQTAWAQGQAAMIVTGSWVEYELGASLSTGFDLGFQPFPSLGSGDALPYQALAAGAMRPFCVADKAANKAGALQYLRMMLGPDGARAFAAATGNVVATRSGLASLGAGSAAMSRVAAAVTAAGEHQFLLDYRSIYGQLDKAIQVEIPALATGKTTVAKFTRDLQAASDAVAADPQVKKFKRPA